MTKRFPVFDAVGAVPLLEPLRGRRAWISATSVLIAMNLLIALAMAFIGARPEQSADSLQLAWGANFAPATTDGEWWRLATAMFLHFGILHLLMNMVALWDSGRLVERLFGPLRFLAIYLASGLMGNLVSLIVHGDRAVSGGASGAIFGIYGALLAFLLTERQRLHAAEFRWMFWGAIAFSVLALSFGLLIPGIDNAAHFGGLLAGIISGYILWAPHRNVGLPRKRLQRIVAVISGLTIAALVSSIPKPRYPWTDEQLARGEIREFIGADLKTNARLRALLSENGSSGASFDQLAGRIEAEVVHSYEQSFEQLSGLRISPDVPSAATLERLRHYAEIRRDATQALAEGIREQDPGRVRDALEAVRRAGRDPNASRSGVAAAP
jgi:rhomboid protease GluP